MDRVRTAAARQTEEIEAKIARLVVLKVLYKFMKIRSLYVRLEENRVRNAAARQDEDEEEKVARLEENRVRNAAARQEEDEEEKAARLEEDRVRKAAVRQDEDEEQKVARLEENRVRAAIARQEENEEENAARLEEDRVRKAAARVNQKRKNESVLLNIARSSDTADFIENSEDERHNIYDVGNIYDQQVCPHCDAYRWPGETLHSCCWDGKLSTVLTPVREPPALLRDLLSDRHFTQHIRSYNNCLAFASLGSDNPPEAGANFKVLGKLYHSIGSLGPPPPGTKPKFSQLYFHDIDNEADNRLSHQKKTLKKEVVESLQQMIKDNNPYVTSFKAVLDICEEDSSMKIVLVSDSKKKPKEGHPGCYNLPVGSELAALMPGEQVHTFSK